MKQCDICRHVCPKPSADEAPATTLTPPQVLQALLDGKTVRRAIGWDYRLSQTRFEVDTHDGKGWRGCSLGVNEMLTSTTPWTIVPDTYDWNEARRRMLYDGKSVRTTHEPVSSVGVGGTPLRYKRQITCCASIARSFIDMDDKPFVFFDGDFEGPVWEDA